MMQSAHEDLARQRVLQAKALSREVSGDVLNLGRKASVPREVMMEELTLPSNRGSLMFQRRQRRVEKYTLENTPDTYSNGYAEPTLPPAELQGEQGNQKENQGVPVVSVGGKHSLVTTLQKTVARKGNPDALAPGYGGPLKEVPCEKFNVTVVPRSYCSPWSEALGGSGELLSSLSTKLPQPPQKSQPASYRCFNRAAMPFGGVMASRRVIPMIGFEALESLPLPPAALSRLHPSRNFNRTPRGWGAEYSPESSEL